MTLIAFDLEKNITTDIYHNTQTLLKQYKKVLWRIKQDLAEINEECQEQINGGLFNYIDALTSVDSGINKNRLENRLFSIENSKSLLAIIDKAVVMLKEYPNHGQLYYDILSKTYLNFYPYSENDMLKHFDFSRTTYYREKKKAVGMLGVVLWGFLLPKYKKNTLLTNHKKDTEMALNWN